MQEIVEFANNNLLLVSGLVASGLAVIFYELRLKARGVSSLSTSLAVRLINDGAVVVDVRDAEKFAGGHISGARNVPEAELVKDPAAMKVKNGKNALLICDTGARSAECATRLRKTGMDNVFSLKGGVLAWQQDNLPVVKG